MLSIPCSWLGSATMAGREAWESAKEARNEREKETAGERNERIRKTIERGKKGKEKKDEGFSYFENK